MNHNKEDLKIAYEPIADPNDHLTEIFDKLFTYSAVFYTAISGVLYTTVSGVRPAIFA